MEMTFSIKTDKPHNAGDGMALWFTEDSFQPGKAFGNTERFKGLGIFFDLYPNSRQSYKFPYVSAMVNDGSKVYNHERDGEGNLLGGCHAAIVNTETPVHAKVLYNSGTLEVRIYMFGTENFKAKIGAPLYKS